MSNNLHAMLSIKYSNMERKSRIDNTCVNIVMSSNLQAILLIQFDIFKHEKKEWNKRILVSKNLQTILSIQHEEKEWNRIILV